jgi:hypothetical protein
MSLIRFVRRLACVAAVGLVIFGLTSPARAQYTVTIADYESLNGGAFTIVGTPTTLTGLTDQSAVSFTGSVGNFSVSNISVSPTLYTSPPPTQYVVFDSNITTSDNKANSPGNTYVDELLITVTIPGLSSPYPTGPVTLSSAISSSSLTSSGGSTGYTGTTPTPTNSNSGYGTFESTISPTGGTSFSTNTVLAYGQGRSLGATYSAPDGTVQTSGNASSSYELTNNLAVFLTSGGSANIDGTTTLTAAVPEPSSTGLTLSGGLLMLAGAWARRRTSG